MKPPLFCCWPGVRGSVERGLPPLDYSFFGGFEDDIVGGLGDWFGQWTVTLDPNALSHKGSADMFPILTTGADSQVLNSTS
jgi:hypothetical protein